MDKEECDHGGYRVMPASLKHGVIQMEIKQERGRSIISSLRQQMPLRASNPLYPTDTGTVCCYIMNPAAGLLQGDRHSILVRVKSGSRGVILGQGATKVFRAPQAMLSRQYTTLVVEPGARLEYLPETVIPFAEACFLSRTNLLIAKEASAFFWEITAPGRAACKELFAYTLVDQQTNIFLEKELIYSDRFRLEPAAVPAELQTWHKPLGLLHGCSHMGTFWAIDPRLDPEMLYLLRRQTEEECGIIEQIAGRYKVLMSGTVCGNNVFCFRALGHSAETVQNAFKEVWKILRLRLYNEPEWPWRKY